MAAFKFNLQQLDILGAYDRYTKELEERKKEELYENKLVEQQVDDFTRYYNPKSIRENDLPLLQGSFKNYETAAKQLNKARRIGNVDEINKNRDVMQKAIADMGDVYNKSVIAKKVAADLAVLKDQERKGNIVIDSSNYKNNFNAFTAGNLNEIEKTFGKPDTWGNVMTDVEYSNNKFNDGLAKTITAFNSNKNNYTKSLSPVTYETRKFGTGKEYKVPVYEVIPDYNKALQLAMVQNDSMKKKALQQFNTELAQGGTIGDIARLKQNKIATIFKKTPDQLTADDLLAYSIAGDSKREISDKDEKSIKDDITKAATLEYQKERDAKRLELGYARIGASKKAKEEKLEQKDINSVINYYKKINDTWNDENGNLLTTKEHLDRFKAFKGQVASKVLDFIYKNIPAAKTSDDVLNNALNGYMRQMESSFPR
jgi:hypothetical protein